MIQNEDNTENSVIPFLISPLTEARGQVKIFQSLIANLFQKGKGPCIREFPEVKVKRKLHDHYLKSIVVSHRNMESTQ